MYKKIKPTLAIVSSLFLAFFLVKNGGGIIEVAHAEVPLNAELDTVLKDLQGKWSLFIQLGVYLSFLLYPYVIVLLNPQFFLEITASSGNGLSQNPILTIWQLSRDIMNTIFAFMLIAGAMVTVITAKQDYLKKYAIKFFLGIILVNFSWFFPRVILDVSHVLTANIYQIPSIIGTECKVRNASGKMIDCIYPTSVRFFQNDTFKDTGDYTCPNPYVCYIPSTLDNNTNISSGILAGLIMNHARLPELDKVMASSNSTNSQNNLGWIKSLIESIIRSGMQLLIVIYITLIMIGMTIALLIRVPILWMTMGFMPLMFLGFVIGDLMPKFNTMEIFKHFVKAAFLPAVLAMPLSIGYIMINALAFSPAPPSAAILENSTGPLLAGVNDLWQFLWLLLTVVVMWKGFKMAMSMDKIFEGATSMITSFGDSVGTLAKNAPLNLPILPMGTKNADGTREMVNIGQTMAQVKGLSTASSYGGFKDKLLGQDKTSTINFNSANTHIIKVRDDLINGRDATTNIGFMVKAIKKDNKDADDTTIIHAIYEELDRQIPDDKLTIEEIKEKVTEEDIGNILN